MSTRGQSYKNAVRKGRLEVIQALRVKLAELEKPSIDMPPYYYEPIEEMKYYLDKLERE